MDTEINGWILDKTIAPNSTLAQGDLIKFGGDIKEKDPLRKLGLIVTADCDLDKKKHAKLITLVPIVSAETLLENYLLPEDCERKRVQIEHYVYKHFEIEKEQEPEACRSLLLEKLSALNLTTDSTTDHTAILAGKFVTDQLTRLTVKEYKSLLMAAGISPKGATALASQITSRGDVMILPDPKILGVEENIAWVRHIWQVPINSIAIRTSEIGSREGEKIARLASPFRYRLTQIFAHVFSDIGLPDFNNSISSDLEGVFNNV